MDDKNFKELNNEELEKVNGGSNLELHFFDTAEQVRYIFFVGDIIYVKENILSKTVRCVVTGREPFNDPQFHCYVDAYIVRGLDGSDLYTRILRDDVVNQAID